MAFLLPALLSGLASWAVPKVAEAIHHRVTGRGGRARRGRRVTAAALKRALMGQGGALAVMNKWPLIERPARYNMGGNLPYGPLNRLLPSIARNTLRGGASHMVRAHTSHTRYGAPEMVRGHFAHDPRPHMVKAHMVRAHMAAGMAGGRASPVPHTVRAHMSRNQYGPFMVHAYTAAGAKRSHHKQPSLAAVMRGSGMVGATHYVAPHVSHSKYGTPFMVKGHYAAGGRARRPRIAGLLGPA
jgi:hypothetical protein